MSERYRLKLRSLKFISAVDEPAQETAKVVLTKRAGGGFRIKEAQANVVKLNDELGLVFGWAFTSTVKGKQYYDLQGDNVISDDEMIKAALEFVEDGAVADEMHDERDRGGRVAFIMPMTPDVAKAFNIETDTTGLMIAMRPPPDVFKRFKSGEYTGFSIAGEGERETVKAAKNSPAVVNIAPDILSALSSDEGQQAIRNALQGDRTMAKSKTQKNDATDLDKMDEDQLKQRIKSLEEELGEMKSKASKAEDDAEEAEKRAGDLEKRLDDIEKRDERDPVEYTADDGTVYRKSQGDLAKMAKRLDESERKTAQVELEKRADSVLKNLKGTIDVRAKLLKAAEEIGDEAVEVLKGADAAMSDLFKAAGQHGGSTVDVEKDSAAGKFRDYVSKSDICKSRGYDVAMSELLKSDSTAQALYADLAKERDASRSQPRA